MQTITKEVNLADTIGSDRGNLEFGDVKFSQTQDS